MHALIDEINKHLSETKQRFDELEHAMTALADLVGQLVEKQAKAEHERDDLYALLPKARRGDK